MSVEPAFRMALLDAGAAAPAGLVSPRGLRDERRFAVYRNNVHVGLVNALRSRFPLVETLVGEAFFARMVHAFVLEHKPASPVLMQYGDALPGFIEGFEPASAVPYLADICRLECATTESYHAADRSALTPVQLAERLSGDIAELRLPLHPAARLVESRFPIGTIHALHQPGADRQPLMNRPEAVLVTRPEVQLRLAIVPDSDRVFAAALFRGATLGEAVAAGPDNDFDFGSALVGLAAAGCFLDDLGGSPK
jgi:hypothetical protein